MAGGGEAGQSGSSLWVRTVGKQMLQVAKALLVDVADEELAAAQPEELVAIPAYLGVYANLEEENVIVGVRLPAAASRLVATALAEGSSSRGVELAWSRRKDDPRRALAWKPAQRRADLPLQISAAVVACASAYSRDIAERSRTASSRSSS